MAGGQHIALSDTPIASTTGHVQDIHAQFLRYAPGTRRDGNFAGFRLVVNAICFKRRRSRMTWLH